MDSLNQIQKKILITGIILILACSLFPPWVHTFKAKGTYSEESAGYSLIISPPARKISDNVRFGVKLDTSRLLLQIFIISIATGAGVLFTKRKDE